MNPWNHRRYPWLGLILIVVSSTASQETPERMRNEEVVRMMVSGAETSKVLEEIRGRIVEFDLSDEMLDEMRIAGVPEQVIEAMKERQREQDPPKGVEEGGPDPDAPPSLTVSLNPALPEIVGSEEPALYFPTFLGEMEAQALQLGNSDEERSVMDLALFLACRTPEHVPDFWRSKSPLGRDFASMPRHRILAFHPGAVEIDGKEVPGKLKRRIREFGRPAGRSATFLRLEPPETLRAEAEGKEPHHLVLGVSIQVGDRFFRVASIEREGVVFGEDARLAVRIANVSRSDSFGLVVELAEDTP